MSELKRPAADAADTEKEARALFARLGQGTHKLAQSTLEQNLKTQLGAEGLAGVYLLRSFELMLTQGCNLDDTVRRHQQMVEQIWRILAGIIRTRCADSDRAFPPGAGESRH